MKFGHETVPLHISCLAHVLTFSVCNELYTEKPKLISDECCDGSGTGNATVSGESDREENLQEKSDGHGSDEEQQNCFDIISENRESIKKVRIIVKFLCKSSVKNDDNLQLQVQQSFEKEKSLFLDSKS